MAERTDFGVLYGQKTTEDALLIYSSYEDAKASPKQGDFIVLTPKDESGWKFLARVEAEIYDEDPIFRSQDKTLVAVHYARIAERELSERDKQKMFSYTYKVRMLGTFEDTGKTLTFTTAVRKLPVVSYHARHMNKREFNTILNKSESDGVPIGHLCIGDDVHKDKEVRFDIKRLRERRTMVFAQSGFGKTNMVKVLLESMIGDTSYGKLIFDLNGEYFIKGKDQETYGIGDIEKQKIKENLVVYTDKELDETTKKKFIYGGPVRLNMHKHLSVSDIIAFSPGFSEVMTAFLLYLDDQGVKDFIPKINKYVDSPALLHREYPDFFTPPSKEPKEGKEPRETKSAKITVAAIRKRIRHLIDEEGGLHKAESKVIEETFDYLKQGKTVIVDLSLKENRDASIISTILVRELFEHNKCEFTSNKPKAMIETVIFVEEAQNVLSEEFVKKGTNPFVRCAKEGRKFKLGMVAITQRPSAISEEIRTQAENFFAFHMGNSDDIRALEKSNANYEGVISKFIQRETIKGNLYMVSSDRPFVVPVKVLLFEELVGENSTNEHSSRSHE